MTAAGVVEGGGGGEGLRCPMHATRTKRCFFAEGAGLKGEGTPGERQVLTRVEKSYNSTSCPRENSAGLETDVASLLHAPSVFRKLLEVAPSAATSNVQWEQPHCFCCLRLLVTA